MFYHIKKKGEKTKSEGKLEFFDTKLLYTKNALLVRIKIFFGSYLRHISEVVTLNPYQSKLFVERRRKDIVMVAIWSRKH